jgi:hypothetical protein
MRQMQREVLQRTLDEWGRDARRQGGEALTMTPLPAESTALFRFADA